MKYTTRGFRAVHAETITEAAFTFAGRAARKRYGRRGHCRSCTPGAYAQDGRRAEFSAFIGYTTGRNETTGHNITFTVWRG